MAGKVLRIDRIASSSILALSVTLVGCSGGFQTLSQSNGALSSVNATASGSVPSGSDGSGSASNPPNVPSPVATSTPTPTPTAPSAPQQPLSSPVAGSSSVAPTSQLSTSVSPTSSSGSFTSAKSINLQTYLSPTMNVAIPFLKFNGLFSKEYRFYPGDQNYLTIYNTYQNLGKPGSLLIWEKRYNNPLAGANQPDGNCVATYGMLWLGSDLSVTETGDWFASSGCGSFVPFYYRQPSQPSLATGLPWSGPGALGMSGVSNLVLPFNDGSNGGVSAYFSSKLIGVLDSYTLPYGRDANGQWRIGAGKTYSNVAVIAYWHGVKIPNDTENHCTPDPAWAYSNQYVHVQGYNSYAEILYLAQGEGIIEDHFLFNESSWFGANMMCKGLALGSSTTPADSTDLSNGLMFIDYADSAPSSSPTPAPPPRAASASASTPASGSPNYSAWSLNFGCVGNSCTAAIAGAAPGASISTTILSCNGCSAAYVAAVGKSIALSTSVAADGTATLTGNLAGICINPGTCSAEWSYTVNGYGTRYSSAVQF